MDASLVLGSKAAVGPIDPRDRAGFW